MANFDLSKSRKTKVLNIVFDVYSKSPQMEQIIFYGKLLDGFSTVQMETLYELCSNLFQSARKNRRSVIDQHIFLDPGSVECDKTSAVVCGKNLSDEVARQLLHDILAKLPLSIADISESKEESLLANAPSLSSIARNYFLDKKTQDLGRRRMYALSKFQRPVSTPGSIRSEKSIGSAKLNSRLAECANVISSEWKVSERLELCALLVKESNPMTVATIHDTVVSRLKKAMSIQSLPDHLILYMFSFLPLAAIAKCSVTCHRWYDLTRSQRLWRFKCIDFGRKLLFCRDLSFLFTVAVKARVAKQLMSANDSSDSRIDWQAVCKLIVSSAFNQKISEKNGFDQEKSQFKLPYIKRKVVLGDTADVEETEDDQLITQLPPVQMFTRKKTDKMKDENDTSDWEKARLGSEAVVADTKGSNRLQTGDSNQTEGASHRSKIYTQARSIIRPTAPVYPDVEKPLKAVLQEVLDTKVLQGHMGAILCLFFDNVRLYSGGADNAVRLWHPRAGRCLLKFLGHKGGVHSLDYCQEKCYLYSGSWDTTIRVWDVGNSKAGGIMSGHRGTVTGVIVISPTLLLSSSHDGTLRLWSSLGCSCLVECSLVPYPKSELQPLVRLSLLASLVDDLTSKSSNQSPVISAALCADGSVFISQLVANPSYAPENRENNGANFSSPKTSFLRWTPWASMKHEKLVRIQGMAIALHGELLLVATYGSRRAYQMPLDNKDGEMSLEQPDSISKKSPLEGGVIWLAKILNNVGPNVVLLRKHDKNDDRKQGTAQLPEAADVTATLTPQLFAAVSVRTVPTALCCMFGKMYVGLVDGSVQCWELGDLVLLQEFRPHTCRIRDIKVSADMVTTCDDDGHVVVSRLSVTASATNRAAVQKIRKADVNRPLLIVNTARLQHGDLLPDLPCTA